MVVCGCEEEEMALIEDVYKTFHFLLQPKVEREREIEITINKSKVHTREDNIQQQHQQDL